LREGALHTLS